MRLVILCEGVTETRVLKEFLKPYCTGFKKVDVSKPSGMAGSGRLKQEFKQLAETELQSDDDAVVFCLIDLLQAPFVFPKAVESDPDPYLARYSYIKRYMENKIDAAVRDRFFAFPVVMELETWLLADTTALKRFFPTADIKGWYSPERIAQPVDELKQLMKRFRNSEYFKTLHGSRLFELASAERVYKDNCRHFEVIVNKLLELQGITPLKVSPEFNFPDEALFREIEQLQQKLDSYWLAWEQRNLADSEIQAMQEIEDQITKICQQLSRRP